jgi:subfamily B ATP-binding cassette protein MsbA
LRDWIHRLRELGALVRTLRPHVANSQLLLAGVIGGSLLMTLFEGIGVGLLVPLLSLLLGGENATPMRPIQWLERQLPEQSAAVYVAVACVAILGAIAAKNAASYTAQILSARLKRNISVNLRDALFRQLQRADLDVFDRSPAGELANVFLVETYRTTMATEAFVGLVQRASIAVFYVLALFYLSWPLTLMVLALAIALGSALRFVYSRLTSAGADLTETNHRMAAALGQTFAGIRVVRVTNSQQREMQDFHAVNVAQAGAEESSARASSLLFPLTETLAVAGAMVIVTCAYVFFVRPGHMLSSYLLAYGFVLLRLLPLLNQLYGFQGHLLYLAGGSREVQSWLDRPVYPQRPFGAFEFAGLQRDLRFEDVSYDYPNGHRALSGVSFPVRRGETVAVVGRSGSGKSTVAALLLRLRAPASGRVVVDGRDYWEFTPESWHRAVALVEQDAFLFHGTLRENIAYGAAGATEAEVRRALAIANLEDVVAELPNGLESIVGERGAMLSGGQRQRIAIARAVIRNPGILILDEATSHLDLVSERLVQQALHRAAEGRTTLVIAHRLATVREADRIVVLDHGCVVESGSWEDLQIRGGIFQQLLMTLSLSDRIA